MELIGQDFSKARYWTEFDEHGERLVMPIRRSWKAVGYGLFGFAIVIFKSHVIQGVSGPFEYVILAGLACFALYLTLNILTSLLAREVVEIRHGELIHGWRLLGLRREKRYQLKDVFQLRANDEPGDDTGEKLISPLKDFGKAGVVTFEYHGARVGLGAVLDAAHGEQVAAWIIRRAPHHVTGR